MAEFYGEMWGRGKHPATASAPASIGMSAHIRSWDYGVYVELTEEQGKRMVRIYRTGGSNNKEKKELLLEEVA